MEFLGDKTGKQELSFAAGYRDLLPSECDVWNYVELFDQLDIDIFYRSYKGEGGIPIDPKLMLRVLMYGLNHGVMSCRDLEQRCRYDVRYIVLSGGRKPDRRTFDRFFVRHASNLEKFFTETIREANKRNLITFERVAVDGSRFKANTKKQGMKYGKMDRALRHTQEKIEELRKQENREEADKKKIKSLERRSEKIQKAK